MRLPLLAALAALTLALVPATAGAASRTVWLCDPGRADNPCLSGRTATVLGPGLARRGIERTPAAARPAIDCFYVYPTVSGQPTPAATLRIDPEERAIARFQASRFSQQCRVWAPMYRQVTLAGLLDPGKVTAAMREQAYADVRAAWRDYLAHHNHGRGVVLIGHSQGTFELRRLARAEIDPQPSVRRRLVSALLLGGNVLVRKGSDVGGDFRHIPACRATTQTGCVVAYSTFGETPPPGSLFGRPLPADRARLEVLCTNPAALGGGAGTLRTYDPAVAFPGLLGLEVDALMGPRPSVSTPWIAYDGAYRAHCSRAGGANVLRVRAVNGARVLKAQPDATWGLHVADVNIALGNLTDLVGRQAAAYARRAG